MRNLLLILVLSVFPITSFIFHIWTTIIGFSEGGMLGGILTLFFPVIAEIYWMINMWGENDAYSVIGIIHLIGLPIYSIMDRKAQR